ncbi:MAG: class I SAM-dependent RNA methyltransferase [Clostridia bacterium]|nr:class I SAM-dependent RNA methyltransferase [Clostridia bacterium]
MLKCIRINYVRNGFLDNLRFCAPCLLGLEGVVADELKALSVKNVSAENGRVLFDGSFNDMARANLSLRCAERVMILLAEFPAKTFDQLFEGTKNINFEDFIGEKDAFPVTGWALNSQLMSIPDCQKIIKKAAVERLKRSYRTDWFEETGSIHQIRFSIMKDKVSIMLDTSGAGLHKRGYRKNSNDAPIKETLAAAIAKLSRLYDDSVVYDPFCGSGTLLIEAALLARNIAPGILRKFSCENWDCIPQNIFREERMRALSAINRDIPFRCIGSDIDKNAIELTFANAKKAGVGDCIVAHEADISDFKISTQRGIVLTNPPYGERLLDKTESERIYRIMGKVFEKEYGKRYFIISPDERFEDFFGRNADKKRKLYNGMIKCNLFMYYK